LIVQTYTHVAIGVAAAEVCFPGNRMAEAVCIIASAVPDLTMVPQYGFDLLAGRQPMTQQSSRLMLAKEIGHSLPLWALLGLIGTFLPLALGLVVLASAAGGFLHIVVDILTHGTGPKENRPYWNTDTKFMWPTPYDLRPFGVWEYRIDYGTLRPKPFEACVLLFCVVAVAIGFFR
jgi:membrane-bound metal-dependent hydrolase YbcI (DUF457 family)